MSLSLVQVAIPAVSWALDSQLASLVGEALDIERRLLKAVDVGRERLRYSACCRSIEALARRRSALVSSKREFDERLTQGAYPAVQLGPGYLDFLDRFVSVAVAPAEARLAASFFPPHLLPLHLRAFESARTTLVDDSSSGVSQRIAFLRQAMEADCGVVEFADLYAGISTGSGGTVQDTRAQRVASPALALPAPPHLHAGAAHPEEPHRESEWVLLREEVARSLANGSGANLSSYHHPVIAGVLRELAYRHGPPRWLPVLCGDGSKADPFPVGGLVWDETRVPAAEAAPALRAALLSIRHVEMDVDVDLAWFPNRSVSRRRESLADTDRWCFKHSLELFSTLPAGRLTVIELYQTGLETAVVGFYRALAVVLREGRVPVAVRPRIFRARGVYVAGEWWL